MPGGVTRLGSIEFINSLPVDWGLISGAVASHAEIVRGTPAGLNVKMAAGELDLGPVSAFFYAERQKDLLLLPDLAIGSRSGVHSVLLFSRKKLSELKEGDRIAFGGEGRTTPALLEIICRLRYGFKPALAPSGEGTEIVPPGFEGALVLGDEALVAKDRARGSGLEIVDLAEEWKAWTGSPIVFAVWAVRREFFAQNPDSTIAVWESLQESRRWGIAHREEIIGEAVNRTKLPRRTVENYFSVLSYDFDESMQRGMKLYFDYAVRCGLLKAVEKLNFAAGGAETGARGLSAKGGRPWAVAATGPAAPQNCEG